VAQCSAVPGVRRLNRRRSCAPHPAEWRCRECQQWFAFEPAPAAEPRSLGVKVAAVHNIECARCGGIGNIECARCGEIGIDFIRGVCRTCYLPDDDQRRSVSPVTVTHDGYGRRL
jgi:hypothetical protein